MPVRATPLVPIFTWAGLPGSPGLALFSTVTPLMRTSIPAGERTASKC